LQIHGTEDPLVPYDENPIYLSVSELLQYWVDYNNCNPTPIITELPDSDPNDGCTVEHIVYEDGDDGVNVEHLKIIGGGHVWPSTPGPGTNDIHAADEIWNFLSRYDINGLIGDTTGIESTNTSQAPANVVLSQNYPNPFNPQTTIRFDLTQADHVTLQIFNPAGRLIRTLVDEQMPSGEHSLIWDGTDAQGIETSSGAYFYRLDTGSASESKSMILLR
jgi:polyhydroxybutyrate depolymerase